MAAPEPYLGAVVVAGGLVAACGTAEQRQQVVAPLAGGEGLPAFAHAEPGGRWTAGAHSVTADPGRRGVVADRHQGAGPARGTRRRPGRQRGTARGWHGAVPRRPGRGDGHRLPRLRRHPRRPRRPRRCSRDAARRSRSRPDGEHRDGARPRPCDGCPPGARRDAVGAAGDDGLPQEPSAVRRHPQHLPGPHVPGRRHVRLPRAHPERRRLGDHGRRDRRRRSARRRGLPGRAADQPRVPARRPGGDPAPRRHRDDGRVRGREPGRPAHRPRPPASGTAPTTSTTLAGRIDDHGMLDPLG